MTDAEALRVALEYLSAREKQLAALFDAGVAPNERTAREYTNVTDTMQHIEGMLRKPRQRGF